MENNKGNILNKYFLYTLLCVCVFTMVVALSCFIAGNIEVFEWDSFDRFFIVLFTLSISAGIIGYNEIM